MTGEAEIELLDLRVFQTDPAPKSRVRKGRTVRRDPSTITGITLHQTACNFGVTKRAVKATGGDVDLAQQLRALGVACHVLAFKEGWIVHANDFESYIYHGNGFNRTTLGLEVEGLYPGLKDDPATAPREDLRTTWKGDPDVVTDLTVETARRALEYMVNTGRAAGMPLTHIYAHRQSSAWRRSDPGQELWQRLVVEYAVPVLGLKTDCGLTRTHGRRVGKPIPEAWDPNGVGKW